MKATATATLHAIALSSTARQLKHQATKHIAPATLHKAAGGEPDCETPPSPGHEGCCFHHSPHSCAEPDYATPPSPGHEGYSYRHSKKPLVLPIDWTLDQSLTDIHALKAFAERQRALGRKLYIGPAGVSKSSTILGEIDNDERRMKELGLMTRKLAGTFIRDS